MTKIGADISHFQETLTIATYDAAHDFIFMKATQRADFTSSTFASRWAAIAASGIPRGAYHFAEYTDTTAAAQADYFCDVVEAAGWGNRDCWVLDLESHAENNSATAQQLWTFAEDWALAVRARLGGRGAMYTGAAWLNGNFSLANTRGRLPADMLLWIARYTAAADPWQSPYLRPRGMQVDPDMWQITDGTLGQVTSVPGVRHSSANPDPAEVDFNFMSDWAFKELFRPHDTYTRATNPLRVRL